jgi:hypothetical protein
MNHFPPPDTAESCPATRGRVTGPFKGYHIASVGCRVGALGAGFLGYYRICRGHPDSFWTADPFLQGSCGELVSSGGRAMRMAESAAATEIGALPANGPNAGWGYGCDSMMPFLREQREARSGEQFRGEPHKRWPHH